MKNYFIRLLLICAALLNVTVAVRAESSDVSNVTAYQEGQNIIIEYNLAVDNEITVFVCVDGGTNIRLTNVTGDVGAGVTAGHKRIIWDVLSQYDKFDYSDVLFKIETGSTTVKDICGSVYLIVKIGAQTWMAENMRCDKYDTKSEAYNASWLTNNTLQTRASVDFLGHTPYYLDATDNNNWESTNAAGNLSNEQIAKLGYLYSWNAAIGMENGENQSSSFSSIRQGICPNGWHIPTKNEFKVLYDYIYNSQKLSSNAVGKLLKTTSGWSYGDKRWPGTDIYGFAALPSGGTTFFSLTDRFIGRKAKFWSDTPFIDEYGRCYSAYYLSLGINGNQCNISSTHKGEGCSVRCVKD